MPVTTGPARPLCFVLMPFGQKKDPSGRGDIDFDDIYERSIRPAVEGAGLSCIRADNEATGGIIHKAMFERLLLCEYAVADMTLANANVFYELGVRHATRERTTLPVFAAGHQPPFDVNGVSALKYALSPDNTLSADQADAFRSELQSRLASLVEEHQQGSQDSPVFQLLKDLEAPDISRLKTDTFRDRVLYAEERKSQLADARRLGDSAAVTSVKDALVEEAGGIGNLEAGLAVDLLLSYRAVSDFAAMVALYESLPSTLQGVVLLQEQYGFALNRLKERDRAQAVFERLIATRGPSSETNGLLGRVYKDRWTEALQAGQRRAARGHLNKAIDTYLAGFQADWRDAYPGINACTLLSLRGKDGDEAQLAELVPVVRYAVTQRLAGGKPDYWDHATLLELAVLGRDESNANDHLDDALAAVRESWEPATTARNLQLIHDARRGRDDADAWLPELIAALRERAER